MILWPEVNLHVWQARTERSREILRIFDDVIFKLKNSHMETAKVRRFGLDSIVWLMLEPSATETTTLRWIIHPKEILMWKNISQSLILCALANFHNLSAEKGCGLLGTCRRWQYAGEKHITKLMRALEKPWTWNFDVCVFVCCTNALLTRSKRDQNWIFRHHFFKNYRFLIFFVVSRTIHFQFSFFMWLRKWKLGSLFASILRAFHNFLLEFSICGFSMKVHRFVLN